MGPYRVFRWCRISLVVMLLILLRITITLSPVAAASVAVSVTVADENAPSGNSDSIHASGCAATGLPGASGCSLRDAILFANSQSTANTTTLTLPAGTYTLTIAPIGGDDATTGDLNINANIVINGAGARSDNYPGKLSQQRCRYRSRL